jgi:hypothetical protein
MNNFVSYLRVTKTNLCKSVRKGTQWNIYIVIVACKLLYKCRNEVRVAVFLNFNYMLESVSAETHDATQEER